MESFENNALFLGILRNIWMLNGNYKFLRYIKIACRNVKLKHCFIKKKFFLELSEITYFRISMYIVRNCVLF